MPMNLQNARVIDPVLSKAVLGYDQNEFVGHHLFPFVDVDMRGGKIIRFGKEDFRLYNTARAPGANFKTVQFGFESDPYSLTQHALKGKLPIETAQEAQNGPGVDLEMGTAQSTHKIIRMRLEYAQAQKATDADNYGADQKKVLAGTSKWSHADSKPIDDIEEGKEVVRKKTGRRPNVCVLSPGAFNAAKNNPSITEKLKYVDKDSITPEMLAAKWEIKKVVVAEGVYDPEDGSGDMADLWGNNCVLAWVPETITTRRQPSYGYTYRLRNHPLVMQKTWDEDTYSWLFPVIDEVDVFLTSMAAGYLIKDPK